MKRSISLAICVLVALALSAAAQPKTTSLAGNWFATLDAGGVKLRLLLKVEKSGDGYSAKFDSLDQDARDLPIDWMVLNGNNVSFSAAAFGVSYEGTLKGDEITGTFKQGDFAAPLRFERQAATPALSRPQDPIKPYPYDEEEVSYRNAADNIKLTGTLTMPRDKSKRYPAVILISGSGPQDRNEALAGHRPFLVLSDHLTRNGIAVLRVDDRGTGGSDPGSPNVTSENFMLDVLTGLEYLKTRKEVDPKKIGLIGHSEGGMIAQMAAGRSKDVAFIVTMAGPGQKGEDLIYTQTELLQRALGADAETIKSVLGLLKNVNAIIKRETDKTRIEEQARAEVDRFAGAMNDAQRKSFAAIEASIKGSIPIFSTPWYRYFLLFDPAPTLRKVSVPVLAINGERDLQVAYKQNLDGIAAALKSAKNKDVTVRSFPHLNHLFQTSMTGLPSEYEKIEETMSPEVMRTISEWILSRTSRR